MSNVSAASANSCAYTDTLTYPIGADPTADFAKQYITASDTVNSSTCASPTQGMTATKSYDTVIRIGNSIYVNVGNSQGTISVGAGNSLTIPPAELQGCSGSLSVTGTLTSSQLDTVNQKIILNFSWQVVDNGCIPPSTTTTPYGGTATDPSTYLVYFNSPTGEYIGGGQEWVQNNTMGLFSISKNATDNSITVNYSQGTYAWWTLSFAAANQAAIAAGTYTGATRYPFQALTEPGLSVYGTGRGCNTLTGQFDVAQVLYDGSGNVTSFGATFSQLCDANTNALTGTVRFNSSVP